ncbi:hypothetical protein PTSG_09172 [Salpingoeca rosetta]|uniref:Uncharacterized protein n=1 Tax=Salpingoeca rosetta (strain ATCC 50818 / BSB-021) TaxID=946362 RepID=F2UMX8_SALR5|nr:uncharacterized protein PTSG_09172 [Salpingoeca rosetta]EGD78477.1 hypothetical protein PTSG_09172 [Salpingoeca rosetta]|eukprot:XP_004989426.1 hypothetical protein PTSG_09172 [Salpingoeca rosetta]
MKRRHAARYILDSDESDEDETLTDPANNSSSSVFATGTTTNVTSATPARTALTLSEPGLFSSAGDGTISQHVAIATAHVSSSTDTYTSAPGTHRMGTAQPRGSRRQHIECRRLFSARSRTPRGTTVVALEGKTTAATATRSAAVARAHIATALA